MRGKKQVLYSLGIYENFYTLNLLIDKYLYVLKYLSTLYYILMIKEVLKLS